MKYLKEVYKATTDEFALAKLDNFKKNWEINMK